jgi:hypothetical protein
MIPCPECNKPLSPGKFFDCLENPSGPGQKCMTCFYELRRVKKAMTDRTEYVKTKLRKLCTRCKKKKVILKFSFSSRSPDGRQAWCKPCTLDYRNENKKVRNLYARKHYRKKREALEANGNVQHIASSETEDDATG